jgi:hypothetical protein
VTDEEFRALQHKARAAKDLLEHEAWAAAATASEAEVIANWRTSEDAQQREQAFAEMKALTRIEDRLRRWMSDASFELNEREKRRKRRAG